MELFARRADAPARVAIAGNPSDGYGGRVLSLAIANFSARVEVRPSARPEIVPGGDDGGRRLIEAAIRRLAREVEVGTLRVAYETDVPRCVGLGGSSAIVVATLRALLDLEDRDMDPARLAQLALVVETEELGIAAGLQDRVAQAYGGLTYMDFTPAGSGGRYEALDTALLPPLFVAYLESAGEPSGIPHADLRRRWEEGEPELATAMAELGGYAEQARDALFAGDGKALAAAIDATFEVRRRIAPLDPRHVELVEAARAAGCAANYAGSGGAIVGTYRDALHLAGVADALAPLGARVEACRPAAQLVHN